MRFFEKLVVAYFFWATLYIRGVYKPKSTVEANGTLHAVTIVTVHTASKLC